MSRPLVQVIIASTRPTRVGEPTGRWIAERAGKHGAFDVEIVDLADVDLPMFAEPNHPARGEYTLQTTKDFSALIDRADGFVIVFPEYNHSFNAPLKNALDHLNREWRGKPVVLAHYGGVAAGARAAVALEVVLVALQMRIVGSVPIPFIAQFLHDEGGERVFRPNEAVETGTDGALDALVTALESASSR